MQRKERVIVLLAICALLTLSFMLMSSQLTLSTRDATDDLDAIERPDDVDIKEMPTNKLQDVLGSIKIKSGNICLVSLPTALIKEWLEFNKENTFKIFAIHRKDSKKLAPSNDTEVISGSLLEALADFTLRQKLVDCNVVHFGALKSNDEWEAAWLASRMWVKPTSLAVWSVDHEYEREAALTMNKCFSEFCIGEVKPVDTSFAKRADLALQLEYAKYIPKKGKSINFFAYNPGKSKMISGINAAVESARLYRKHNPKGTVLLSLFTNDKDFDNKEGLFDHVIGIKHDLMFNLDRQWTTRVIYTSFAPFEHSLFVDSDTWNCGELSTFFDFLESHDFDFAINGHEPDQFRLPDCGVYAYKWNERTRKLLLEWFNQFVEDYKGDDQARLLRAMRVLKGKVNIGLLSSTHSCRFSPGENEDWGGMRRHQQTMILTGPARIIHAREANAKICDALNVHTDRKRVFVCKSDFNFQHFSEAEKQDKLAECLHPVFNQQDCHAGLDNLCHNNDWDADPQLIEPNKHFVV